MCISLAYLESLLKSQGYKDYINTRIKTSIRITIHKHYNLPIDYIHTICDNRDSK